jgi:hypothetical protein
MGGKVALALLQRLAGEGPARHGQAHSSSAADAGGGGAAPCAPPRQLWVLDSQPGPVADAADAGSGVSRVLQAVHVRAGPPQQRTAATHAPRPTAPLPCHGPFGPRPDQRHAACVRATDG